MTGFRQHVAGPDFYRNSTPYHRFRLGIGESADRPLKLLVPILNDNFGDFMLAIHLALQYAARIPHSMTSFFYVRNRPYKADLIKLYPLPHQSLVARDRDEILPAIFGPDHGNSVAGYRDAADIVNDWRWQDVILSPQQLQQAVQFDRPMVPCRIPPALEPELSAKMTALGLDPSRWFSCIHWREPNYEFKPVSNFRDCDPAVYLPLIDHIIGMGGQVVRIGHPQMARAAPRPGFVDLAMMPNSVMLQAYAASRARFSVMGPGGGTCLTRIMQTPMGLPDAAGWFDAVEDHHYLLTHTLVTPDGHELRQEALMESGLMNQRALDIEMARRPGYRIVKNTTAQLLGIADFMYERTEGVDGWRAEPPMDAPGDEPFSWPAPGQVRARFIDL